MKQIYIIHEQHPRLLLFFAGWGADQTPFRNYRPQESDYLLCYDYRSLDIDTTGWEAYREINIVGWSMGVWAASQLMARVNLPDGIHIAINGTPFPIDDQWGIPEAIYQGTLDGLTDASLHKFLRRMCHDSQAFRQFLEVTPRRPLEELREELQAIATAVRGHGGCHTRGWHRAVIGRNDRIIPPANQQAAWEAIGGVETDITDDAHYEASLFQYYLQDLWTND